MKSTYWIKINAAINHATHRAMLLRTRTFWEAFTAERVYQKSKDEIKCTINISTQY